MMTPASNMIAARLPRCDVLVSAKSSPPQSSPTAPAAQAPAPAAEPMVRLDQVSKRFDDRLAVDGVSFALENAAANCGAPPLTTFFTVTLPAVMPGVITGGLLMFILALNEFIVSLLLVDARIVTLPVLMYNSIRAIITPDLAALSVVYIAIAAVSIWILDRLVGLEVFLKSK